MGTKKSIEQFVNEKLGGRNKGNNSLIKEMVRDAIHYYQLKSREEMENDKGERREILFLSSIMEENMLNKLVQLTTNSEDTTIEEVYKGNIVRRH